MFLAHSFRLRDPWQCEAIAGGVRWSRVFHRPTGLEDDDALWLVCSGLPSAAAVTLNGAPLSPCATLPYATGVLPVRTAERATTPSTGDTPVPPHQYNVTALLAETNRIEILVPTDRQPTADCRLPSPAFPYDVRLGVVGHS